MWALARNTRVWNGPVGVFELDKFATGIEKSAELGGKGVTTIIGGGDSVAAVEKVTKRYTKSGSSKWLWTSVRASMDSSRGGKSFPSLMDLCIHKIWNTFSILPRDISQQIFYDLVYSQLLDVPYFMRLGIALYRILRATINNWMGVVSSQGSSLLSVDVSGSDVTIGRTFRCYCLCYFLNFYFCDLIQTKFFRLVYLGYSKTLLCCKGLRYNCRRITSIVDKYGTDGGVEAMKADKVTHDESEDGAEIFEHNVGSSALINKVSYLHFSSYGSVLSEPLAKPWPNKPP
ncbi:phosphoglycerate kinase, partial [Striga asiatica]